MKIMILSVGLGVPIFTIFSSLDIFFYLGLPKIFENAWLLIMKFLGIFLLLFLGLLAFIFTFIGIGIVTASLTIDIIYEYEEY